MTELHGAPADAAKRVACRVTGLERVYGGKSNATYALNGISLQIEQGEFVAIMGPSGSGKTTLLNCIATIDKPTCGTVEVGGTEITRLKGKSLARFRREDLGFIFQDANLVETLTAYENIALPLTIRDVSAQLINIRVQELAKLFDVASVLGKLPAQMSGGQRQRVAAARAVAGSPKLVLADEPTGALDSRNAVSLLTTLDAMNKDMGATILMVTHDPQAASYATRALFVKDGKIFTEFRAGGASRKDFFNRIMEVQALLGGGFDHVR